MTHWPEGGVARCNEDNTTREHDQIIHEKTLPIPSRKISQEVVEGPE